MTVIGIDIGGTKIAGAVVAADGSLQHKTQVPTPQHSEGVLQAIIDMCRQLQTHAEISGIGIGTAGLVDFDAGKINYASNINGWAGTEAAREVSAAVGLPVRVDNDVNAMALGEASFGAGRGYSSGLYVTVGTGIGGAIILDGKLWRGALWTAGEVGHMLADPYSTRMCSCGQAGHLEAIAAGPAMARRYCELTDTPLHHDLRQVVDKAKAGDTIAETVIAESAKVMGRVLAGVLTILDTEILVIGGGVAEVGDLWWQPFVEGVRSDVMMVPQQVIIKAAELGTNANIVGAAALVL
jgi:glucokinase